MTAAGSSLSFFDLRKPSLILKSTEIERDEELKDTELHSDDINDIAIQPTSQGFKVASCDDTGATLVQDINILTGESSEANSLRNTGIKRLQGKHDNICYRAMFSKVN